MQILVLMHPKSALVDGQPARPGHRYGGEQFTVQVGELKRSYKGSLRVEDGGAELRLVNEVALEDYVASVVGSEYADAPRAAREALAIVVRTYALAAARLDDTTKTQWYRGLDHPDYESARATEGQVLTTQGKLASGVAYSQDCGGATRPTWHSQARIPDTHPGNLPKGTGHGVGLCQRGALFLASKGASTHQILARYFPGYHIGRR